LKNIIQLAEGGTISWGGDAGPMPDSNNPWVTFAKYANLAVSFGITMAVAVLGGFYGGRWLDRRLGTEPFFMILGMLAGIGLAFKSLLDELGVLTKHPSERGDGRKRER
jgi:F0F1-type ATP synthase assembly protein I